MRPLYAKVLGISLAELAVHLRQNGPPNGQAVPSWLTLYASLEQTATHLWSWQPVTLHALLQTAAYAEAVEQVGPRTMSADAIARRVELRLARQAVLSRHDDPLHLAVVLDESVMHRVTGSPAVMAAQLAHLAELAQRPNIDINVLPLSAGVHSAGTGAFTFLDSTTAGRVVCLIDRVGIRYVEDSSTTATYEELFAHLKDRSLDGDTTVALINDSKERYS